MAAPRVLCGTDNAHRLQRISPCSRLANGHKATRSPSPAPPGASTQITYRFYLGKYCSLPAGSLQVLKARWVGRGEGKEFPLCTELSPTVWGVSGGGGVRPEHRKAKGRDPAPTG